MNPEQQIQMLIEQAPQYGANPTDVQTIAPALLTIASRLKHPQYFILQTLEHNWLMTTLTHRTQPNLSKNVVYAFSTLKDAAASPQAPNDPQVVALPTPIIQILFQMLAMKPVDSIVFLKLLGIYIQVQRLAVKIYKMVFGFMSSSKSSHLNCRLTLPKLILVPNMEFGR